MKKIWIALVDDWELRGNGLGSVKELQHIPALRLIKLYESLGIRGSFNVEVMQQLAFEKYADNYDDIKEQRALWIKTVKTMHQKGFDIQLHVHPQWHNAFYDGKYWKLDKRWNIADYPENSIEEFIKNSIGYLKSVIPEIELHSFRGGGWGVCCPSFPLFKLLEKYGIKMDISMVNGVYYEGESMQLDYRSLESPYMPYYPDYSDVRKIAQYPAQVIEIPTQSFTKNDISPYKYILVSIMQKAKSVLRFYRSSSRQHQKELPHFIVKDPFGYVSGKAKQDYIVDLSAIYSLAIFKDGIDSIIKRAQNMAVAKDCIVPLVFENHTKDLVSEKKFTYIKDLILYILKKYDDNVSFVTLKDIAENINLFHPILKRV
jgi:hypothetical protein